MTHQLSVLALLTFASLVFSANLPIPEPKNAEIHGIFPSEKLIRGVIPPSMPRHASPKLSESSFFVARDHFNPKDEKTWQMRYFDNSEYYRPGGSIFIFVGGEVPAHPAWTITGHLADMAKEYGGHVFSTEHRYYGISSPVSDTSTENLKYLSVRQAISDLVAFVSHVKKIYPNLKDAKVILAGGSYAGNVAAYARHHHPDIFAGAWASSGPVLAKVDFFEYKEAMSDAYLKYGGKQCHAALEEAFQSMEATVASGNTRKLEVLFNLCSRIELDNQLDVWHFFSTLTNVLTTPVQYHKSNEIEIACAYVLQHQDPVEGLASYIKALYGASCFNTNYDSFVKYYKNPDLSWGNQYRQWMYQTCTEFGYYQSSSSDNQPFGKSFPYDLNINYCKDIFDGSFSNSSVFDAVEEINKEFGGLKINATNVIYTNGDIDPWARLSIHEPPNEEAHAEMIPDVAHCGDMYSISSSDSAELKRVKERISELVGQWIK